MRKGARGLSKGALSGNTEVVPDHEGAEAPLEWFAATKE
jgi:hypothetical protein